jgi:cysteinyl-tRNA synthetase
MSSTKVRTLSHKEQRKEKQEQKSLEELDDQSRRIIEARKLVKQRDEFRIKNEFLKSDEVRDRLLAMGVDVIDQKNGGFVLR